MDVTFAVSAYDEDFGRMQGATTKRIVTKYGEEERRHTRPKDASMARDDSSDRPWVEGF
jgi:hypothetical protein